MRTEAELLDDALDTLENLSASQIHDLPDLLLSRFLILTIAETFGVGSKRWLLTMEAANRIWPLIDTRNYAINEEEDDDNK